LLQRDEWVPLRDDERRDSELESVRAAGEESERDESLGDRPVDRRMLGRDDDVVRDPPRIKTGGLCCDRNAREPLRIERLAVIREDETEVERRHVGTLSR
jgi:hypothetical protein